MNSSPPGSGRDWQLLMPYSGIADPSIDATTPCRNQEAERMSGEEEDAVYECPFLRDDPGVIFVIVGVVEERIKSCKADLSAKRCAAAVPLLLQEDQSDSQRKGKP